ncbi:MAG TPA: hypothetical protein VHN80_16890 [Kineosporiaceae bacterium]|nr:hypothetical protein [Kineosporiaceae bacterium]
MATITRWWSGRAGVDRVDLAIRWQLYLLSASDQSRWSRSCWWTASHGFGRGEPRSC